MRKPRVAHVFNTVGLGGVPEAALHLIRALPPGRFDCRVYVMNHLDHEEEGRGDRLARFEEAGVPVSPPRAGGDKVAVASDLCAWLMAQGIDLLHTHSYKLNLYTRLAGLPCRGEGLRIGAHYHNHYDNRWDKDGSLTLERMLARSMDALLAVSASVRDHFSWQAAGERLAAVHDRILAR